MSNVTYSAGNLTITVAGLDTVEQALGDLKRKTPAAAKVAINATARQARKLMVAKAKTRYAVNAAGRRHLKDLVQRKKASNSSLLAELHVASMRNDLGYFKTSPAVPTHFTSTGWVQGPSVWKGKVLKANGMRELPGRINRRVTIMTEEDLKKKPAAKKPAARKAPAKKANKAAAQNTDSQNAPAQPAPAADPMVGKPCPLCGKGVIIKGKTAYGCSNWKAGCQYRQPFSQM